MQHRKILPPLRNTKSSFHKRKSNYQNILQHYGQSKLFYHIFATPGNCIFIISVIITQIYSVCPASGRANGVKSAQNAAFIFVRPAALLQLTQDLFNRNALGKDAGYIIPGFCHLPPLHQCNSGTQRNCARFYV